MGSSPILGTIAAMHLQPANALSVIRTAHVGTGPQRLRAELFLVSVLAQEVIPRQPPALGFVS